MKVLKLPISILLPDALPWQICSYYYKCFP